MNTKKMLAGLMASAVAATAIAAAASANEGFLMYAAGDWSVSAMSTDSYPAGNIDVTADGTYTVTTGGFMFEDEETGDLVPATATGTTVLCVDITDLAKDLGFATAGVDGMDTPADKMALAQSKGIQISGVTVSTKNADGTGLTYEVDDDKIIYGDIEGNGKLRIEVYNEYGDTKNYAPFDYADVEFDDTLSVTFTISGLSGAAAVDAAVEAPAAEATAEVTAEVTAAPAAAETTAAVTSSKGSPDTGIADIAAVVGIAIVAGGAVVVAKKRK